VHRKVLVLGAVVALFFSALPVASAATVSPTFISLIHSATLAQPGVILIDPETNQTLFENQPDALRAPASVLKLVSMTTAIRDLGAETVFHTAIYESTNSGTYLMQGESDPWLTASPFEAAKFHRAFLPQLINDLVKAHPGKRSFTIDYNGVYSAEVHVLQRYFAPRFNLNFHLISSQTQAQTLIGKRIGEISSPKLSEIVEFTLLYSDNLLADRLARTAARKVGLPTSFAGLQQSFEQTFTALNVEAKGLVVKDGNGLSKETRISARTVAELLLRIQSTPELKVIFDGLPVAGETGTLKTRFVTDAPKAVGLIRAKTGWINSSVSMAGYVTVGDSDYVFAIIANHIKQNDYSRQLAREAIDKALASIARPKTNI